MPDRQERDWLPALFKTAAVPPDSDLETVQRKMDALANRAAPLTRRWWKWILFVQALALLIPLAWFRRPSFMPLSWIAVTGLLTVAVFVFVNWWLRWRGMQKTWARSRLVAEVARSLLSTRNCARLPALESLQIVPSIGRLQAIAEKSHTPESLAEWKAAYLDNRLENQIAYFRLKQREAERQRRQLSRWGTLMLDLALAFAFAGAVITLSPQGESWRRIFGDYRFEITLGLAGVVAPLGLLLLQLLRGVQELNRRTARYAQQQEMLMRAKSTLESATTDQAAMDVVDDTERQLLAEVLEWYFHAETAEHYFLRPQKHSAETRTKIVSSKDHSPVFDFLRRTLGITSIAGLFLLRVVLGRIPWIVGSAAAALMWIAYHEPTDAAARDQLRALGKLTDANANDWASTEEHLQHLKHGCILIAHGLYGDITIDSETRGWPKVCAKKLNDVMGANAPDICLVDWHQAAQTAKFTHTDFGIGKGDENLLTDLSGVRNQAYEVGNLVAFRLAMMIMDQEHPTIRKDRPMHLIGHSAGGFVVTRVAILLKKFGVAPQNLHVTILDTPAPELETTKILPDLYPDHTVDFYISSEMGGRAQTLRAADFSPKIHVYNIPLDEMPSREATIIDRWWVPAWAGRAFVRTSKIWEAHRYSFQWFMNTITRPQSSPGEGFNRSPFAVARESNNAKR